MERCIYLSGIIVQDDKATLYRKQVARKFASNGFTVLDPIRSKGDRLKSGQYLPGELIQRDLQDVLRCKPRGVVLAVMASASMKKKVSIGTPAEIAIAYYERVPVIFVTDDPKLAKHPWLIGMCVRIFVIDDLEKEGALDEVVNYTIKWYGPKAEGEVLDGDDSYKG